MCLNFKLRRIRLVPMIGSNTLRHQFLQFFKERGHVIIPGSSLTGTGDPSVLLTTAGMQQFKDYYIGARDPLMDFNTRKVATVQKCFRLSDIENIGDDSHLSFFEMLGNFSFGDYFKKEAINMAFNFLVDELKIDRNRLTLTVFGGDKEIGEDIESFEIVKSLGLSLDRITKRGQEDNFWGPTGFEGPCGPTVEFYIDGLEVWNLVFNEYYKNKDGKFEKLSYKGVDTGMGLERVLAMINYKANVFETDIFQPIIAVLRGFNAYEINNDTIRRERIIADHIRGAVFLISEGLMPSNLRQGYVLRRILRRLLLHLEKLGLKSEAILTLVDSVLAIYENFYTDLWQPQDITKIIIEENERFRKVLNQGLKMFKKINKKAKDDKLAPSDLFNVYQSFGFPKDIIIDLCQDYHKTFDLAEFDHLFKEHQERSRLVKEHKIGGIRTDPTYYEIKLHTATHLLHQALRDVLGKNVRQMGSDINEKRLRFDFNFERALSENELQKIEKIVNQKIKEDLDVSCVKLPLAKALQSGALSFFREKYPSEVKVYSIDNYSKEICNGPHVRKTSELKNFKIIKEEGIGQGIRRIKAIVSK